MPFKKIKAAASRIGKRATTAASNAKAGFSYGRGGKIKSFESVTSRAGQAGRKVGKATRTAQTAVTSRAKRTSAQIRAAVANLKKARAKRKQN
jgi:hypothetical protein